MPSVSIYLLLPLTWSHEVFGMFFLLWLIFPHYEVLCVGLQIQRLAGVDSDFAPFVQHAGVPSIDMYYGRGKSLVSSIFIAY